MPAGVADPSPEIMSKTRHLVDKKLRWSLLPFAQYLAQYFVRLFVGIQQKNPVVSRQGSSIVFLVRVIGERALEKRNAMLTRNIRGAIGAAGIHHDHFVGDAFERFQRASQVVFLIERDNARGDQSVSRQVRFSRASIAQLRESQVPSSPSGGTLRLSGQGAAGRASAKMPQQQRAMRRAFAAPMR